MIIDVRTPEEYDEGHIENCVLINFRSDTFQEEINELDKSYTYLIYCRSGGRSAAALKIMKENGFENVYNMLGGIKGWNNESYPLEK
jgi:rhodanese-related sulfurtransferase